MKLLTWVFPFKRHRLWSTSRGFHVILWKRKEKIWFRLCINYYMRDLLGSYPRTIEQYELHCKHTYKWYGENHSVFCISYNCKLSAEFRYKFSYDHNFLSIIKRSSILWINIASVIYKNNNDRPPCNSVRVNFQVCLSKKSHTRWRLIKSERLSFICNRLEHVRIITVHTIFKWNKYTKYLRMDIDEYKASEMLFRI